MAAINVQRYIAEAQSNIVAEALKSANIEIVGGENDFFEKVVKAVSVGRSVDRMVGNSTTLTDIKESFFNGDPDRFRTQLKQWIKDFGISSEDVKNLTIAALLGKLMASTSDLSVQSLLKSALTTARERGFSEIAADTLISERPPIVKA